MQKGFGVIYILIGVLSLAVVFGGAYYLGKSQVPKPQPTVIPSVSTSVTPDETANWKTYTDEVNKFSISYPNEWREVIRDSTNSDSPLKVVILTPLLTGGVEGQYSGIFISIVENKNKQSSKEYVNQEIIFSQEGSVCEGNIKVVSDMPDSLKNLDVTIIEGLCGVLEQGPYMVISRGNFIIKLSSSFYHQADDKDRDLVNQVFASFKFIDNSQS